MEAQIESVKNLNIWVGSVEPKIHSSSQNSITLKVTDDDSRNYLIHLNKHNKIIGSDSTYLLNANKAASDIGLLPEIIHFEDGIIVHDFADIKPLSIEELIETNIFPMAISAIKNCHTNIKYHLRGEPKLYWVFQDIRDLAGQLYDNASHHASKLTVLLEVADSLEEMVQPLELVPCHNNLRAENFLIRDRSLYIFNWSEVGFSSPLSDLASFAIFNKLDLTLEGQLLQKYFSKDFSNKTNRQYLAFKSALLLRTTLASMLEDNLNLDTSCCSKNLLRDLEAFNEAFQAYEAA